MYLVHVLVSGPQRKSPWSVGRRHIGHLLSTAVYEKISSGRCGFSALLSSAVAMFSVKIYGISCGTCIFGGDEGGGDGSGDGGGEGCGGS